MSSPAPRVGTAAITENLLKRRWSSVILRYLQGDTRTPAEILKKEPDLSAKVLSERLRAMLRYGVIQRFPHPPPSTTIEYRLTMFGQKIQEMLKLIEQLDQQMLARRTTTGLPSTETDNTEPHDDIIVGRKTVVDP